MVITCFDYYWTWLLCIVVVKHLSGYAPMIDIVASIVVVAASVVVVRVFNIPVSVPILDLTSVLILNTSE